MDNKRWHRASFGAIIVVLILSLATGVATGCTSANASAGPLELAQTDNGKAFTVKVGDEIQVVIPGNVTTGYAWITALSDKDAALLVLQGEPAYAEEATDAQVVGAGGVYTFTFKATAAGQATLKLVYERSWESGAPEQTFEVEITVE
jgi:inhibitor of cysteine peptidase